MAAKIASALTNRTLMYVLSIAPIPLLSWEAYIKVIEFVSQQGLFLLLRDVPFEKHASQR